LFGQVDHDNEPVEVRGDRVQRTPRSPPWRDRAARILKPRRSDRRLSRREALGRLVGGAAAAVSPFLPRSLSTAQARMPALRLTGRAVLPSDPAYDTDRFDFNKRFDLFPQIILYCQNAVDVGNGVRWARSRSLPISVRSGGHSYEAFSLGPGRVIDLSDLNHVVVDRARGTVEAQPGIRLLEFYRALSAHGVTVPGGTCAGVGLSGLTLGGGVGFLTRKWGLASDNLQGLELVDASGRRITASDAQNADLFWACRGGGGSFGVVTSLIFETHPLEQVTVFELEWPFDQAEAVLASWQQLAPFWPDELTTSLEINGTRTGTVTAEGLWLGSETDLRALLQPFLAAAPADRVDIVTTSYIDAAEKFSGQSTLPYFKAKSDYARVPLVPEAIATIRHFMAASPTPHATLQFQAYGGAVNRIPGAATAFPHRDHLFSMQYITHWSDPREEPARLTWIRDFYAAMRSYVSGDAYSNMCDVDLEDWPHAYYGENFQRLVEVKSRYDPYDVFHFAQSIPPRPP
jgi:FAD/FMN-containing dehydrogenase